MLRDWPLWPSFRVADAMIEAVYDIPERLRYGKKASVSHAE